MHRRGRQLVAAVASALGGLLGGSLIARARRARSASRLDRRIHEAVMDAAPLGIAVFGRDLRFERVSQRFAEIDGAAVEDHVGRRPHELDSQVANLFEPVLAQVYRSRETTSDRLLTIDGPDQIGERHLEVTCFPVLGTGGVFLGAGLVVEDITQGITSIRRSAHLLELSRDLTRVLNSDDLAARVSRFLSDAFDGNALVAFVDDDRRVARVHPAMSNHNDDARRLWERSEIRLDADDALGEAIRRGEPFESTGAKSGTGSVTTEEAAIASGDLSAVWVPVLDSSNARPLAVVRVGWPYQRQVTEASITLFTTLASLMALALGRIRLAGQLADDRFQHALNAMFEDVSILSPLRDDAGRIIDFRVEFANESIREQPGVPANAEHAGQATDVFPTWQRAGLFDRFVEVVETGRPWSDERFSYVPGPQTSDSSADAANTPDAATTGTLSIQAVRFDDGCLVASRDVTRIVALEQAERETRDMAVRQRVAIDMLQQAALPLQMPSFEQLDIGALYQPALLEQPIGGDWYDVFRLDDRRAGFVIADVSGHGPRSAAFMVKIRNVMRAMATQIESPAGVLGAVNEIICGHYAEASTHFITCCYAVIDPVSWTIEWSSAAHPAPILAESDGVGLLTQQPGLPLAVTKSAEYHDHRQQLLDGERLLLYTDGLFERRDEAIDEGLDRLCRVLDKATDLDAQRTVEQLGASVIDPFDDLAALVIDVGTATRKDASTS